MFKPFFYFLKQLKMRTQNLFRDYWVDFSIDHICFFSSETNIHNYNWYFRRIPFYSMKYQKVCINVFKLEYKLFWNYKLRPYVFLTHRIAFIKLKIILVDSIGSCKRNRCECDLELAKKIASREKVWNASYHREFGEAPSAGRSDFELVGLEL